MSCGPKPFYRFFNEAHWRSMAGRNLSVTGDGIGVAASMVARRLPPDRLGTPGPPPGSTFFHDRMGRLSWITPDRRVVRRYPFGPIQVGRLYRPVPAGPNGDGEPVDGVFAGCGALWVLCAGRLDRYASADLQFLGSVEPSPEARFVAAVGDGLDGLWSLESRPEEIGLRHIDCWGRTCCPPVEISATDFDRAVLAGVGSTRLVIWPTGQPNRFTVVDGCTGARHSVCVGGTDRGAILAAATDEHGDLHLISTVEPGGPSGGGDTGPARVRYEVIDLTGQIQRRQLLDLPAGVVSGDITGLLLGPPTLLVTRGGLIELGVAPISADSSNQATLITPTMISPELHRPGWQRAELSLQLPAGSSVTVTWAATSDEATHGSADAVFADPTLAPDQKFALVDGLLSWHDPPSRYVGRAASDGGLGKGGGSSSQGVEEITVPVRLGTADTHLWLRVDLQSPVGSVAAPTVDEIVVRYPADSYLQYLPAIYRRDPTSVDELEQLLAPLEFLYGTLEDQLDRLPSRIDPETAPDEWTPFLLSWLGFPPLGDLDPDRRRDLLRNSEPLLSGRGTLAAAELALDLVTDGRTTIVESANEPGVWILPARQRRGARWSRLGCDAVVRAQDPPTFRPGRVELGRAVIGAGCTDPVAMIASRAAVVTIVIQLDESEAARLEPIIHRLIPVLIPAHCRVEVLFDHDDPATVVQTLDRGFRLDGQHGRLHHSGHWRVGANTKAGRWRLAEPDPPSAAMNHRRTYDDNLRLG